MDKRQLGELIRAAREAKGLSMKGLGKLVHNSKTTVQNWEEGTNLPRPDTLALLVSVLDLPEDTFQRLAKRNTDAQGSVYPSLQDFLREQGDDVSDTEREWLTSQRFADGDPGDTGWWASQLLAYRRLQRARGASQGAADVSSKWLAGIVAYEAKHGALRGPVRERLLAVRHHKANEIPDFEAAIRAAVAEDAIDHPEDHERAAGAAARGSGARAADARRGSPKGSGPKGSGGRKGAARKR